MEFYFPEIKFFLEILRSPTKYWLQSLIILNSALHLISNLNTQKYILNQRWFEMRNTLHHMHACLIPFNGDYFHREKLPIMYHFVWFNLIGNDSNWEKLLIVCLSVRFILIGDDFHWEKLFIMYLFVWFHWMGMMIFIERNSPLCTSPFDSI